MATRPRGYGLSGEVKRKMDSKYDHELEIDATNWIEQVLGERVFGDEQGPENLHRVLKSGVVLCRLANKLGGNLKPSEQTMAFKMMENIGKFLTFCEDKLGVPKLDLFQTVDLYEKGNLAQVIHTIVTVGSRAHTKNPDVIPPIGPKVADANPREFSEEQLRASQGIIGLQAGYTEGASQAGDHFGRPRQIAGHDAYN